MTTSATPPEVMACRDALASLVGRSQSLATINDG